MTSWMRGWVAVVGIVGWASAGAGDGFVGRVVDASGKAVEGAQVCATPLYVAAGATMRSICGTSGTDGAVTLAGVPPGAQQVSVRAPNHASIENARVDWSGVAGTPFTWAVSPAGAITARLTDPAERGISGAKVVLRDRIRGNTVQATTDANGALRVDGLAAGYWKVEIEPAEYRSVVRDNVSIEPGATTDLGALRARASAFVEGQVVDAAGAGVGGAEVRVQESTGSRTLLRSTTTDETGRFRIGGLPPRAAVDVLVHPRKDFAARSFMGLTLPVAARPFAVDPTVVLTGRAVVDEGTLPKGSRVVAWLHAGHPSFDANAGMAVSADVDPATGRFTLEGVAPGGEVDVRLYAPGAGEATITVPVDAKDTAPIELHAKPTGFVLRGQVVDRAGRPIEGARLGAAVSGPDGRFTIDGFQPGNNRIAVQHPQYATVVVEFPAAGDRETIVVLDAGGTVEGVVTDPRGRPIVGARVAGTSPGLFATTGVGGRYRLEHVPSGEGEIERQSSGVNGDVDRRKVTVALGESLTANFRMPPGVLEGSVTRGGEPVTSATLSVRQSSQPETKGARPDQLNLQSTASDEEGGYRAVGLRPGPASVVVTDGKQTVMLPVTIAEEGASRLDVEMPRYSLDGVVLDGSGAPVAGALVASGLAPERNADGKRDDSFARTLTDGEGRFRLYTDEEDPKEVTVCTCAQGCHDLSVDAGARGAATLWFAPVGAKPEGPGGPGGEVSPAKR